MPDSERRRPRVATCEDWDEDAQATLPGSRTTAQASIKHSHQDIVLRPRDKHDINTDGGDSGYASRAATTVSDATTSSRRKMPDLRVDTTGIPERERKPYLFSHSTETRPSNRRQPSQTKEPSPEKPSAKFREERLERAHEPHARPVEPKQTPRTAYPPTSPVVMRTVTPKISKDDNVLPAKLRRSSSSQQPRPLSMAPPSAAFPMPYAMYPAYAPAPVPSGYATPVTPSVAYAAMPFSYAAPPPLATPQYVPFQPAAPSYFDQLPEPRSARPSRHASPVRRNTVYGDPVIRQGYSEPGMAPLDRMPSKESRPHLSSHRSARSVEVDRANMPPPPRPQHSDTIPVRRPSNRRSQTYHPQEPTVRELRERAIMDDSDDERDYRVVRAAPQPSARDRRESATRPPSSYRPPTGTEPRDRPVPRKSVSYSAGTTVTKVATSQLMPRRMTVPLEQKEAEVEEYQSKRNSAAAAASGLTAEALRKFDQRTSSSKSETGSNFSHQSSSKDSSGRDRSHTSGGTKTSITLPSGMTVTIPAEYMKQDGRPLSISAGGMVFSLAPEGKENERPREQKRLERAPSIASRTSKRSIASSVASNRDARGRELPSVASRRPSQLEERGPSLRSSRQPSRAASPHRRSRDQSSRRRSGDYSKEYDELYAQG
jgi:hypothetical protein